MYNELLAGNRTDPVAMINDAIFDTDYQGPVVVRDIEYYSLCEHHLLPFFGRAHVADCPFMSRSVTSITYETEQICD